MTLILLVLLAQSSSERAYDRISDATQSAPAETVRDVALRYSQRVKAPAADAAWQKASSHLNRLPAERKRLAREAFDAERAKQQRELRGAAVTPAAVKMLEAEMLERIIASRVQ